MSEEIIFAVACYQNNSEEPSELMLAGLFNNYMAAELFADLQRKRRDSAKENIEAEFITLPVHNLDRIKITEFNAIKGSVGVSCERIVCSYQNAISNASALSIAEHIGNEDMACRLI